jgi:hypothetical protein
MRATALAFPCPGPEPGPFQTPNLERSRLKAGTSGVIAHNFLWTVTPGALPRLPLMYHCE